MTTADEKRAVFRRLHASGCFVMPNPWDVGSLKYLARAGFPALATTSAGLAFSCGKPDGHVPLRAILAHVEVLAGATDLPLNVDFEAGYADTPEGVAESVRLCAAAGAAGLSIEDYTGEQARGLFPLDVAVARLKAARGANADIVLTGRSEGFIRGAPDLEETIRRLRAYAEAGADCLYAPGLTNPEQIRAVVSAVAPKPVNVLIERPVGVGAAELAAFGVRRISTGSALARAAWGGFIRAVDEITERGSFDFLAQAPGGGAIVSAFD